MNDVVYDSRNPAIGHDGKPVRIGTFGRPRVTNLSMGQARAWRNTNSTTPHHRRGGPVGVRGQQFYERESPPKQAAGHARPRPKKFNKAFKKQTRHLDPLAMLNKQTKRANRACLHALLGMIPMNEWLRARSAFLYDFPDHAQTIVEIERRNAGIAKANGK